MGPLERQSEKAREYLKKREILKEYEVHVFLMEMENMKAQLTRLEEAENAAKSDLAETTDAFEKHKA